MTFSCVELGLGRVLLEKTHENTHRKFKTKKIHHQRSEIFLVLLKLFLPFLSHNLPLYVQCNNVSVWLYFPLNDVCLFVYTK